MPFLLLLLLVLALPASAAPADRPLVTGPRVECVDDAIECEGTGETYDNPSYSPGSCLISILQGDVEAIGLFCPLLVEYRECSCIEEVTTITPDDDSGDPVDAPTIP